MADAIAEAWKAYYRAQDKWFALRDAANLAKSEWEDELRKLGAVLRKAGVGNA